MAAPLGIEARLRFGCNSFSSFSVLCLPSLSLSRCIAEFRQPRCNLAKGSSSDVDAGQRIRNRQPARLFIKCSFGLRNFQVYGVSSSFFFSFRESYPFLFLPFL